MAPEQAALRRGDRPAHLARDHPVRAETDADATAAPERWSMQPRQVGVNHIAIAYPDREAFLTQLRHLKANGVEFIVRGNHGMTHSAYIADPDGYGLEVLYEVPEEAWIGDVNAALNFFEPLPEDQELEDTTDYRRFEAPQSTS